LWDIEKVSPEAANRAERLARLARMNLTQRIEATVGASP